MTDGVRVLRSPIIDQEDCCLSVETVTLSWIRKNDAWLRFGGGAP
jgi:hypothetical protein